MNYKGFKKIAQDEHTATFRHMKNGHELKISHKSLSPKLKKQLDDIPVQKLYEGEMVNDPRGNSEATPDSPLGTDEHPLPADTPVPSQMIGKLASMNALPENAPQTPDDSSSPPMSSVPTSAGSADAPNQAKPDPFGVNTFGKEQASALEEQSLGQQAEQQAKGQLGEAQAKVEAGFQDQMKAAADRYQQTLAHLNDQDAKFQSDLMAQHIDPKRYIDNMSTGGKISTGIGLILGGMGSGMTGGPNLAFQFLQSQIDRDIDSQKSELGKKQNLLSHNMALMGNARAGMELTRLQLGDIVKSQLAQATGQSATPMAQAVSQNIQGMFDEKKSQLKHNIAVQQAMLGGAGPGNDPETAFQQQNQFLRMNGQEAMAKDRESKHVPGVPGQASVPLTPDNRSDLVAKQNLDQKLADYIHFSQQHAGSLDPRIVAIGKAKAAELNGLYRQATHGGIYKAGEAEFIERLVDSNPTKFFNELRGVIPKAQALMESNRASLGTLKKSLGFQEERTAPPPQYKTVNGVTYMRGPKGEAVPVKRGG